MTAPGACPTDEELSAFIEGALEGEARSALQIHVADCVECGRAAALLLRAHAASDAADASRPTASQRAAFDARFELGPSLGRGAMGAVYAAQDRKLDRRVALKWLHADAVPAGTDGRARLISEAKALAKLNHQHVVSVFDVVELDGEDVLVMEYVEGSTLKAWLLRERPSLSARMQRFVECAEGLDAAHHAGLIHRDFKPENVLVGRDGKAKVVDFGLAKHVDVPVAPVGDGAVQRTNALSGTPAYAAPEVWRAERPDSRSDQYAWGLSLYEALTGSPAFAERDVAGRLAAMQRQAFAKNPAFRALPWRARRVVLRALHPERAHRFPTLGHAAQALRGAQVSTARITLAIVTAAALGAAAFGYRHAHACDDAGSALARSWNDAARGDLQARVRGLSVAFREPLATELTRLLDAWAQAWRGEAVALCEDERTGQLVSSAVQVVRAGCLERAAQQLDARLAALRTLDDATARQAVDLVEGLPRPDVCRGTAGQEWLSPRPTDPQASQALWALQARLDADVAERELGRIAPLREKCTGLRADSTRLGWLPMIAAVETHCGATELLSRESGQAQRSLQKAFRAGVEGGALDVAVAACGLLLRTDSDAKHLNAWFEIGEGLAARAGAIAQQPLGRLLSYRAMVEHQAGRSTNTAPWLERALALPGTPPSGTAFLEVQLAFQLAGEGRHLEARELAERAVTSLTTRLGPSHLSTLFALNTAAGVAMRGARFEDALALAQRNVEGRTLLYGASNTGSAHANAAEAALNARKLEIAAKHVEAALPQLRKARPASGWVDAAITFADVWSALGRWQEACALVQEIGEAVRREPPEAALQVRWAWAEGRCAAYDSRDGRATLRALAKTLEPRLSLDTPWVRQQIAEALRPD